MKMSIKTPTNSERLLRVNVLEQEEGKKGFPVYINEVVDGKSLPGYRARLFLNEGKNENKWFTITGPLRKRDAKNGYELSGKKNEQGEWVDANGQKVDSEASASPQFVFHKSRADEIVFGEIGSLSVKNNKQDGSPSRETFLRLKLYDEQEALMIARQAYRAKSAAVGEERKAAYQELNRMQAEGGKQFSLYIERGYDFLTEQGFSVNRNARGSAPAP